MSSETQTFKIVVIGDTGVGKSSYIKRHLPQESEAQDFEPQTQTKTSLGTPVTITTLPFSTNSGEMTLQLWDAPKAQVCFLDEEFYAGAKGAIVMFDVTSKRSYQSLEGWFSELLQYCDPMPETVICGNKVDVSSENWAMKADEIDFHRRKQSVYYGVSAKDDQNLQKPFVTLLQKITRNPNLKLKPVSAPRAPKRVPKSGLAADVEHWMRVDEKIEENSRKVDDELDGYLEEEKK